LDLNYLLHRQQVSLMRADAAVGCEARHAHRGLAQTYASAIERLQRDLGAGILAPKAV
jgi:hypothetical protein